MYFITPVDMPCITTFFVLIYSPSTCIIIIKNQVISTTHKRNGLASATS